MQNLLNLLISNIYLYLAVIAFLVVLVVVLTIIALNKEKRKQIKETFEKVEAIKEESENIEEVEESAVSKELEDLITQMKQDMEVKPEEVVARFEQEQEEKAIISYQELVENVKKGKIVTIDDEESDIDFVQALQEELNQEPIMTYEEVKDVESSVTPEQLRAVISEIESPNKTLKPKFKTSEFISPVFGTQKMDITYPTVNTNKHVNISIDKTVDLEELTEALKKSEAFLNSLIEFRNNL